MGSVMGNVMSNGMGNVVETCLTMSEKENGQATKFNENQRESMLALKEKVATLLYVGDRPPCPLLHKAHHISICSSSSSTKLLCSDQRMRKGLAAQHLAKPCV